MRVGNSYIARWCQQMDCCAVRNLEWTMLGNKAHFLINENPRPYFSTREPIGQSMEI